MNEEEFYKEQSKTLVNQNIGNIMEGNQKSIDSEPLKYNYERALKYFMEITIPNIQKFIFEKDLRQRATMEEVNIEGNFSLDQQT